MYHQINNEDILAIQNLVGNDNVFVGESINEEYTHDEMTEYGKYTPEIVVKAKNTNHVSVVMKYCYDNNIAVTPRGAGTGLCGGCVALHGGIVLSLEDMNQILEIDEKTMTVVLEPGVRLMTLIAECAKKNLLYAPDPGEKSASVGGNVMTNAGGMRAVKYGVTRDYVRGMEVVLPNGEIMQLGGKIAKNSSGYSLKDLLVGSEGTLAIVTKLYMKLLAKPRKMISLLIPFNDLKSCLDTVPAILALPNQPTTLEFCEKEVIDDATEFLGKQFPSNKYAAYLIASYSGNNKVQIAEMYDDTCKLALARGAIDVYISDTDDRQSSIWDARGAFLEAIKNSTTTMDECDVVVNINQVYDFLSYVRTLSEQYNVRIRSFGHAGDGNLHIYVCKDNISDEAWPTIVTSCMDAMYRKASELKGFTSGEHGIGHAKKKYLAERVGPTQIALMKGIKDTFDPKHILNPGKVIE